MRGGRNVCSIIDNGWLLYFNVSESKLKVRVCFHSNCAVCFKDFLDVSIDEVVKRINVLFYKASDF
jgi:hypothetical protein